MLKTFQVDANPAKAFFVDMITRDIELQDAILDLLDNCVDGIRRSGKSMGDKPYAGYFARITFTEDEFVIEDNCGGIPKEIAEKYAFMMGRPAAHKDTKSGTIGVYGIGMKRAIFKMGRSCVVHSHTKKNTFEVKISKSWLEDDSDWMLEAVEAKPALKHHGTRIAVSDLHSTIKSEFADGSEFRNKFKGIVRDAYSLLLEKGFEVRVNGEKVASKLPVLLWDKSNKANAFRPYIYEAEIDGVNVFLAVGFRGKPEKPTSEEPDAKARYDSEDSGWTIVCNDRVILPFDKTRQTGWDWGGVPRYHTQFIAITGFVIFDGNPANLPMTTTKRGVDANSSAVYADGQTMLTLTGIVGKRPSLENVVANPDLVDWKFTRFNYDNPVVIEVPELTLKERIHVNQLLPKHEDNIPFIHRKLGFQVDQKLEESERKIRNYVFFQRHYPHFGKVSI